MTWTVTDKEFNAVTALSPEGRYEYFVKKVVDWGEVWSLEGDGWALMGGDDGRESVPVWPHPRFAQACAVGQWVEYRPKEIDLQNWLSAWTPGMTRDNRSVAVFPISSGKTVTTTPTRLSEDLERELGKY